MSFKQNSLVNIYDYIKPSMDYLESPTTSAATPAWHDYCHVAQRRSAQRTKTVIRQSKKHCKKPTRKSFGKSTPNFATTVPNSPQTPNRPMPPVRPFMPRPPLLRPNALTSPLRRQRYQSATRAPDMYSRPLYRSSPPPMRLRPQQSRLPTRSPWHACPQTCLNCSPTRSPIKTQNNPCPAKHMTKTKEVSPAYRNLVEMRKKFDPFNLFLRDYRIKLAERGIQYEETKLVHLAHKAWRQLSPRIRMHYILRTRLMEGLESDNKPKPRTNQVPQVTTD